MLLFWIRSNARDRAYAHSHTWIMAVVVAHVLKHRPCLFVCVCVCAEAIFYLFFPSFRWTEFNVRHSWWRFSGQRRGEEETVDNMKYNISCCCLLSTKKTNLNVIHRSKHNNSYSADVLLRTSRIVKDILIKSSFIFFSHSNRNSRNVTRCDLYWYAEFFNIRRSSRNHHRRRGDKILKIYLLMLVSLFPCCPIPC